MSAQPSSLSTAGQKRPTEQLQLEHGRTDNKNRALRGAPRAWALRAAACFTAPSVPQHCVRIGFYYRNSFHLANEMCGFCNKTRRPSVSRGRKPHFQPAPLLGHTKDKIHFGPSSTGSERQRAMLALRHTHERCVLTRRRNSQDPSLEVTQGDTMGAPLLLLRPGAG